MQEDYAKSNDGKFSDNNGFMFNIHAPQNLMTGEGRVSAVLYAKLCVSMSKGK